MASDSPSPTSYPVVSSVAEEVRRHVGSIEPVPAAELPYWLLGLSVPTRWTIVPTPNGPEPVTRIALCRVKAEPPDWDGCEVIALYRFIGCVPEELVRDSADRTLRDLGADGVLRRTVELPSPDATAVRSSGFFVLADQSMWGQFSNYVINGNSGGALVEHSVIARRLFWPRLARDIRVLTETLYQSLVASLDRGQNVADR